VLDDIQATPVSKPGIDEKWVTVPAEAGDVPVRIVRRPGSPGPLPVILYVHGGGWVLGNAGTHDRLVRELAGGADAAVAFVEYDRSPEARHPVAIEQAYATAQWITRHGQSEGLDSSRIAVAGDSVGGNMAAVLAILAKQRGDVTFVHQSLYSLGQLAGLPETFLIVDENDVLRDEGEAYGRKLTEAGVRTTIVRYDGTLHDFMMLNSLRGAAATTSAIEQAIHVLRQALGR
jgi:acetyl esterase/lipase